MCLCKWGVPGIQLSVCAYVCVPQMLIMAQKNTVANSLQTKKSRLLFFLLSCKCNKRLLKQRLSDQSNGHGLIHFVRFRSCILLSPFLSLLLPEKRANEHCQVLCQVVARSLLSYTVWAPFYEDGFIARFRRYYYLYMKNKKKLIKKGLHVVLLHPIHLPLCCQILVADISHPDHFAAGDGWVCALCIIILFMYATDEHKAQQVWYTSTDSVKNRYLAAHFLRHIVYYSYMFNVQCVC